MKKGIRLRYAVAALAVALTGAVLLPINDARAEEMVGYAGIAPGGSTPKSKQVDLDKIMDYYATKESKTSDQVTYPVQKESIKGLFNASMAVYNLWKKLELDTADVSGSSELKSFKDSSVAALGWIDSVARAVPEPPPHGDGQSGNPNLSEKLLSSYRDFLLNNVRKATKLVVNKLATDLEDAKGTVEPGKRDKYQKVVDKLKEIGASGVVNLEDTELSEYVGLANELKKNPNADIKLPGEPEVDPAKETAKQALKEKIAEIDKALTANPAEGKNLSDEQRRTLEEAKRNAQGVLDTADAPQTSADDLKRATGTANTALEKANEQIAANKQQAKDNLNGVIDKSNTLAGNQDLPEANKQELNTAIQKANQAKEGNPTVKQLEEAKAALDQAYAKAEKAKNQAVADKAQAKATAKQDLQGKLDAIKELLRATDGNNNLKPDEREALEQAKQAAESALATADAPETTAEKIQQAVTAADGALTTAKGQVTTNKEAAKSALGEKVTEATKLVDSLPETAKQDLKDAITAANQAKEKGTSTVKDLETAKSTLEAAIAKAKEAKAAAEAEGKAKETAKQALTAKIAEIERLLTENPDNERNLKPDERLALEQARDQAKAALLAAPTKTADQLNQDTATANTALEKAKGQITTNKEAAKTEIEPVVTKAKKLSSDPELSPAAKQKLDAAIQKAESVKGNGDSTVKQLEDAKTALEQAYAEAEQAKAQALADKAKAKEAAKQKLADKIAELEKTLKENPAESQNLSTEERQALEQAKDAAKATLADVEKKSTEELNQATATADQALQTANTAVTGNKNQAKSGLDEKLGEADKLSNDPALPAEAKQALDAEIAKAKQVTPEANTAKEIADAKSALEAAISKAKEAKAEAEKQAKDQAKQDLTAAVGELEEYLNTNSTDTENLSGPQREAAEAVKQAAKEVLDNAEGKTTAELKEELQKVTKALTDAKAAVTENKNTAKGVLDPEITKAEEVAAEEGIPADAKTALDEAIAAAKKITTDNTVSEIKAAKEALDTAVANAKAAKTKAEHDAAKAELAAKLEDINEVLKANPEASKNLGEAERAELEKAKANLEALLENADSKPASELKEASTQADTALEAAKANVADNQGNAKEKLAAAITEATKVSDDKDLPAEAKKALDEAIAKAEAVKEDPNASVAAIEEATAKLAEAKEQATKARDEAVAAKEAAKKALGDKIAEIDKVLNANPEEGKNLTSAERQALEAAKAQAEAVLKAADTKTTDELNAATAEADQALNQAKGNVTKNQDISRKELLAALAQAKALSEAPLLPADAKKALDEAIAKAQAVYDDPAATVSALEEAKETLLQAYQVGETAHKNAIAEKFRKDHAEVLAKTVDTVTLDDYAKVESALADYAKLGPEVQKLLGKEKATLDALKQKLDALKAQPKVQTGEKLSNTGTETSVVLLVSLLLTLLGASGVVAKKKLTA